MNIRLFSSTICLCLCLSIQMNAQKFGYLNSSKLLMDMPEVKTADASLQTYQQQLVAKGEQMMKALETKYMATKKEVDSGTLSAIQIQQKEAELAKDQQAIQAYELEVQQKLVTKREELYKPILDKVNDVLKKLGEEQGYTMIFDYGSNALLHVKESQNLMAEMKSRLGI